MDIALLKVNGLILTHDTSMGSAKPVTHCESVSDCTLQDFAVSTQQPDAVQSQSSPVQHAHTVSVVAVHAV